MSIDRRLENAAKAMVAAAEQGQSVLAVLQKRCPYLYRQIARDGKYPNLLAMWGRCVNVDENAGQTIVHPAILRAIGELAGVPMRGTVVHAGLQHTYGYLFSLIETPYGAKRDRWVSTALERGFGLDLSLLGERPKAGTLLANLTWFLGRIVYRADGPNLARLMSSATTPAPALKTYNYARLAVCRIVEQAVVPAFGGREIRLVTDLVPFPQPPDDAEAENTLLIYSVQSSSQAPLKLITAFPIRQQTARDIKASVPTEGPAEVRLRYNAYLAGLYGRAVQGRCYFADSFAQN